MVGDDADLVIGSAIYGETQGETAERLGIPFDRARKRFQRAISRLQKLLSFPEDELSHFGRRNRVSSARPRKGS